MATLAIAGGAAALGGAAAWGMGASIMTGIALGWSVGAYVGNRFFGPEQPGMQGPRLENLQVQSSAYGEPIPITFGSCRIAGNIIWSDGLKEHKNEEEVGGKGGGGQTRTTYTYTSSFAVGICEGEIVGIRRIWADGKLLLDESENVDYSATVASGKVAKSISVYTGTETQEPDPLIEAIEGEGNVPGYRGLAYVVFEDFQLGDYGNRIPNLEFELATGFSKQPLTLDLARQAKHISISDDGFYTLVDTWTNIYDDANAAVYTYDPLGDNLVFDKRIGIDSNYGHLCCARDPWYPKRSLLFRKAKGDAARINYHTGGLVGFYNYTPGEYTPLIYSGASGAQEVDGADGFSNVGIVDYGNDRFALVRFVNDELLQFYEYYPPSSSADFDMFNAEVTRGAVWSRVVHDENGDVITRYKEITGDNNGQIIILVRYTGRVYVYDEDSLPDPKDWWDASGILSDIVGDDEEGLDRTIVAVTLENNLVLGRRMSLTSGNTYPDFTRLVFFKGISSEPLYTYSYSGGTDNVSIAAISDFIFKREGLQATDFDVTDLENDYCVGFVITQEMNGKKALEPLMRAYQFDVVEVDHQLICRKREKSILESIPDSDLAAHEYDSEVPEELAITTTQEKELPQELIIEYQDVALDYQKNAQKMSRFVTGSSHKEKIRVPLILDSTKAQEMVETLFINKWTERYNYSYAVSTDYIDHIPGDIVTVKGDNILLQEAELQYPGIINFSGVRYDISSYKSVLSTYDDFNVWQPYTVYTEGDIVVPTTDNGYFYVVVDATGDSLSGSTEPTWPTTIGDTITDNDLVWKVDSTLDAASPTFEEQQLDIVSGAQVIWAEIPTINESGNQPLIHVFPIIIGKDDSTILIYKSVDSGETWTQTAMTLKQSLVGKVDSAPGSAVSTRWDHTNSITITPLNNKIPYSKSKETVLTGQNIALLGDEEDSVWEILAFADVTDNGDGSYTLSTLLRGLRGTEHNIGAGGSYFALVDFSILENFPVSYDQVGGEIQLKAILAGTSLQAKRAYHMHVYGKAVQPWSPAHVKGERNASGDLTITWFRRTRTHYDTWNLAKAPLLEDSESYEVDILDGSGNVVRTLTASDDTTGVTYTATQQTDDFGSTQSSVDVKVYQIGTVGRGFATSATI